MSDTYIFKMDHLYIEMHKRIDENLRFLSLQQNQGMH